MDAWSTVGLRGGPAALALSRCKIGRRLEELLKNYMGLIFMDSRLGGRKILKLFFIIIYFR